MRLNTRNIMPPGGFRYLEPTTNKMLPAHGQPPDANFNACLDRVKAFLKANSLPIPSNLDILVEEQICARMGNNLEWCNGGSVASTEEIQAARSGWPSGWTMFKSFTSTVADWILHGKQRASDGTITYRASICASCPNNLHPPGCTACNIGSLRDIIAPILASSPHAMDSALRGCSICGCDLRVKVRVPQDILLRNMSADKLARLPKHCWLKKEAV